MTTYGPTHTGTKKGSKLLTALLLVAVIAVIGGATVFWTDRAALLEHIKKRDHLAVPACFVMRLQGPPPEAQETLCEALQGDDPQLRAAAARTLGAYRSRDLVANLGAAAVHDPDPAVRAAAVEGLTETAQTNAIPFIQKALIDPADTVKAAACIAVGKYQLFDSVPLLLEYLASPDVELHTAAKRGLDAFLAEGEESFGLDRHLWQTWYQSKAGG